MKSNRKQQGFTLIELMIVVAIVGILIAIAIPAYKDYTARAQMSEAMSLASGAKVTVSEYYADAGGFPGDNSTAGLSAAADITGKYVLEVGVGGDATGGAASGVIRAQIKPSGVAEGIENTYIELSPTTHAGSIEWVCRSDALDKYVPTTCRTP